MNSMFIIGLIIFILYISSLLHLVNKGHQDQENEFINDPEIPKKYKNL